MIDPQKLFHTQPVANPLRPGYSQSISEPGNVQLGSSMRLDQVSLQVASLPAGSFDDNDETLPENLIKEGFLTKLMFGLKAPWQLFNKDPKQIIATGHTDANGNPIRLSRSAAEGYERILSIAKQRGISVKVVSSYRSVEKQQYLWDKALKKYGSEAAARKWVAPPGKSRHQQGNAIDMHMYRQGKRIKQSEFDEIIALAGMYRPMSWETWHVEPLSTKAERHKHTHEHS